MGLVHLAWLTMAADWMAQSGWTESLGSVYHSSGKQEVHLVEIIQRQSWVNSVQCTSFPSCPLSNRHTNVSWNHQSQYRLGSAPIEPLWLTYTVKLDGWRVRATCGVNMISCLPKASAVVLSHFWYTILTHTHTHTAADLLALAAVPKVNRTLINRWNQQRGTQNYLFKTSRLF